MSENERIRRGAAERERAEHDKHVTRAIEEYLKRHPEPPALSAKPKPTRMVREHDAQLAATIRALRDAENRAHAEALAATALVLVFLLLIAVGVWG